MKRFVKDLSAGQFRAGQAMLLMVLSIGGTILGATTIAGLLMLYQIRSSIDFVNSAKAVFAADAGTEWAQYNDYHPFLSPSPSPSFSNTSNVNAICYGYNDTSTPCGLLVRYKPSNPQDFTALVVASSSLTNDFGTIPVEVNKNADLSCSSLMCPVSAVLASGDSQQFKTPSQDVSWVVACADGDSDCGSIDDNGVYSAPSTSTVMIATVKAILNKNLLVKPGSTYPFDLPSGDRGANPWMLFCSPANFGCGSVATTTKNGVTSGLYTAPNMPSDSKIDINVVAKEVEIADNITNFVIKSGGTLQFSISSTVSGAESQSNSWTLSPSSGSGSIDNSGFYDSTGISKDITVTVKGTNVSASSRTFNVGASGTAGGTVCTSNCTQLLTAPSGHRSNTWSISPASGAGSLDNCTSSSNVCTYDATGVPIGATSTVTWKASEGAASFSKTFNMVASGTAGGGTCSSNCTQSLTAPSGYGSNTWSISPASGAGSLDNCNSNVCTYDATGVPIGTTSTVEWDGSSRSSKTFNVGVVTGTLSCSSPLCLDMIALKVVAPQSTDYAVNKNNIIPFDYIGDANVDVIPTQSCAAGNCNVISPASGVISVTSGGTDSSNNESLFTATVDNDDNNKDKELHWSVSCLDGSGGYSTDCGTLSTTTTPGINTTLTTLVPAYAISHGSSLNTKRAFYVGL